jgi:hypothetical protein
MILISKQRKSGIFMVHLKKSYMFITITLIVGQAMGMQPQTVSPIQDPEKKQKKTYIYIDHTFQDKFFSENKISSQRGEDLKTKQTKCSRCIKNHLITSGVSFFAAFCAAVFVSFEESRHGGAAALLKNDFACHPVSVYYGAAVVVGLAGCLTAIVSMITLASALEAGKRADYKYRKYKAREALAPQFKEFNEVYEKNKDKTDEETEKLINENFTTTMEKVRKGIMDEEKDIKSESLWSRVSSGNDKSLSLCAKKDLFYLIARQYHFGASKESPAKLREHNKQFSELVLPFDNEKE